MNPVNDKAQLLADLSERTIYLMGGSFILGSLFTILMLLVLDFMRQMRMEREHAEE